MKITALPIATFISAGMLWSGVVIASDYSLVSEAAPVQQEEGKPEAQPTMSDMQPAQPVLTESNQEPVQAQPETTAPSQDQAPSGGDRPAN